MHTYTSQLHNGAFDWTRTNNLCLRRATLYPVELQMHNKLDSLDLTSIVQGIIAY